MERNFRLFFRLRQEGKRDCLKKGDLLYFLYGSEAEVKTNGNL